MDHGRRDIPAYPTLLATVAVEDCLCVLRWVAKIVNVYGITDVVDLLDGPNLKTSAVSWLAGAPSREEIARRVSPLTRGPL